MGGERRGEERTRCEYECVFVCVCREESLQSVHMRVRDKTREKGERQEKGRDMRERQVRDTKSDK